MSGGFRPGFIMARIDGKGEKERVARLSPISSDADNLFQLADYIAYTNSNAERIEV
jgi:hypothetical protein